MLFNSKLFVLCFLPLSLTGYFAFALSGRRAALRWLLACSLLFYAWWKPVLLGLLITSVTSNYLIGRRISQNQSRQSWLIYGLIWNLALLGFFKYANFIAFELGVAPPFGGVLLPLGISFFTFQQIMFLVDLYHDDIECPPVLDYACFISFFPHLISGPIVRPNHILPQIRFLRPFANLRTRLAEGIELFLLGLGKKLVLADTAARFADPGFAAAAHQMPITLLEAWAALLAYALQIYFDFSGYSDMAIGLALMFGIHFPINFNSPYQASNISEFWRRWNITLSRFLREYLYIPLGGNRKGERRRIFNLMLTMLLGGLWHGAALKFMCWGLLHGAYLVIHRWFTRAGIPLPKLLSRSLTLICVILAWVPFRAENFSACIDFCRGLFGLNGIAIPSLYISMVPCLARVGQAVPTLPFLGDARTLSLPQAVLFLGFGWFVALCLPDVHIMSPARRNLALGASFAFSIQALFFSPYSIPFLYFQF